MRPGQEWPAPEQRCFVACPFHPYSGPDPETRRCAICGNLCVDYTKPGEPERARAEIEAAREKR